MTPEILVPALLGGCALLSFIAGYYATTARVCVVPQRYIPPELSRLASALGITEDIPTSDSYGRRIHDLFEERDRYADNLRAEIRDLREELEEAHAELAAHAEAEIVRRRGVSATWGDIMIRNPDVPLPAKWWYTYDAGLKQAQEDSPQREITGCNEVSGCAIAPPTPLSGWVDYKGDPIEFRADPEWCCFPTATSEGYRDGYRDVTYRNTKTGKSWTLRTPVDTPTATLLAMRDLAGWARTSAHWGYGGDDVYWVNPETQYLCHYPMGCAGDVALLGTVSGLAPGYYYAPVQA